MYVTLTPTGKKLNSENSKSDLSSTDRFYFRSAWLARPDMEKEKSTKLVALNRYLLKLRHAAHVAFDY